jgi:hypothetical protein
MANQPSFEFSLGLSEEEKRDLETMIVNFQKDCTHLSGARPGADPIQEQLDTLNKRLADLTRMFLTLDRRMKPLYEIIRLTYQKSEILNERINTIIESLGSGEILR